MTTNLAATRFSAQPARRYGRDATPVIVAHRGGAALGPENTLEAFATSVSWGVRYLETDVRVTADGIPIAFHDATLDRITDMSGRVRDLPWSEIRRALVAGSDQGIAPIEEVLSSFPGARFMVDIKDVRAIEPMAKAIRRTNAAGRVCVAGAWDGWLNRLQTLSGQALSVAVGWKSWTQLIAAARFRSAGWLGNNLPQGSFIHAPWTLGGVKLMADPECRRRLLNLANRHGITVMTWTVDDAQEAGQLLDDGVFGIITDRPDIMAPLWVSRGLALPRGNDFSA